MSILKKLISATAVVACLAFPQKANAGNSAELMAGNRNVTLDLRVSTELVPRLQLVTAHISSINYNNEVNYFGFISFGYNVWGGLSVLAQAQAISGVRASPRLGLEYFQQIGDLGIYGEVASIIQESSQIELLANVNYKPKLTENLRLVLGLESATLFSPERGYDFSTQRLRAGLGVNKFEFGSAINLVETSENVDYNLGGFVKVNF